MKKLFAIIASFALSACSPIDSLSPFDAEQAKTLVRENLCTRPTQQMIALGNLPNPYWKRIDLSICKQGSPIMMIPCDQTSSGWSESIRTNIYAYRNDPDMNASRFLQKQIDAGRCHCKHISPIILATSQESVFYSLSLCDCDDNHNQIQIGKIFNGRDAVYQVYYTALRSEVCNDEIARMSRVIGASQLVSRLGY